MLIELCGWMGAACILSAYLWVTYRQSSRGYHLMNLIGCGLLLINSYYHRTWPSVGINSAWAVIAVLGICRKRKTPVVKVKGRKLMTISEWMEDPDRGIPSKGDCVPDKLPFNLAQDPVMHPILRRAYPFHDDI